MIGEDVEIGNDAVLLAHVVIYRGAKIGKNFFAHAHSVVRENCRIGNNVLLQNGVVIGADGFGFAKTAEGRWHKIPQPAPVVIEDDVEVQANSCIDRASVGETRIGRGVKVDNLVQVGHGSHVGEDALLCSQVGLAGSTEIGNRVILTGQVGVVGHCKVGRRCDRDAAERCRTRYCRRRTGERSPGGGSQSLAEIFGYSATLAGDCAGCAGKTAKPRPLNPRRLAGFTRLKLALLATYAVVNGWTLSIFFRQAAFDHGADFFHQAFAAAEIFGLDRGMENHFHQAGLDGESRFRHGVVRADDRHGNYRNAAFHRQIKRALFEGQKFAVERALAFHVDRHVESLLDHRLRGAHGFDAGVAIAAVHGNQAVPYAWRDRGWES